MFAVIGCLVLVSGCLNADGIPPTGIANFHNVTFATTSINWTWNDPTDADFSKVMVYLNGVFKTNVTKGSRFFLATGLVPNTAYTLGTHTVDSSGNINQTWVNHSARTASLPDTTPPASVTNLHNVTFATTSVNWTWNDPTDTGFSKVMVYLNGVFKTNVTKGSRFFLATGLVPNTAYTLGTHTVDSSGNINQTWVNHSARTASLPDTTPPASVTNLHNVTFATTSVNWTWNDPTDTGFSKVMVYLNGVFKTNVTKGSRFFLATGLVPNTAYTLGTHTVDSSGNINQTWVNHSARTAPSSVTSYITVVVPNGGNNWQRGSIQTITWSYTGSPGSSVKIELLKGTTVNRVITQSTSIGSGGAGSYGWTIPATQLLGTDYKIRITSTSNAAKTDTSNANFTISAG
jgi:hypothetical protein